MAHCGLADLPTELVINLFEMLGIRELLSCRQTSQHFRDLIDDSPSMQYKIELSRALAKDCPSSDYDLKSKREMLAEYQRVWIELDDDNFQTTSIDPPKLTPGEPRYTQCWDFKDGVYARSIGLRKIQFFQLPSKVRRIAKKSWEIALPVTIMDFCLNPSLDLIVVVTIDRNKTFAHHFKMSTGEKYNGSSSLPLEIIALAIPWNAGSCIYTLGDFVGILVKFGFEFHRYCLKFWNWRDGSIVLHKEALSDVGIDAMEPRYHSFAFISSNHVLLSTWYADSKTHSDTAVVDILDLNDGQDAFSKATRFHLPALATGARVTEFFVDCSPPSATPSLHTRIPFQLAQTECVILLNLVILDLTRGTSSFQFFLHTRVFLDLISLTCPTLPWDEWGPDSVRVFELSDFFLVSIRGHFGIP